MSNEEVIEWLKNWLNNHGGHAVENDDSDLEKSFLDLGWVDSFGLIEMISEIENSFEIHFEQEMFLDERFVTISGLANIITELRNENNEG